jgi:hypothetical protein
VECGRSRDTCRHSDLARWNESGYCTSHSRFFWGLWLDLITTLGGPPVGFALTSVKTDERQTLPGILAADPTLAATPVRAALIHDRQYYGADFEAAFTARGLPNGRSTSHT